LFNIEKCEKSPKLEIKRNSHFKKIYKVKKLKSSGSIKAHNKPTEKTKTCRKPKENRRNQKREKKAEEKPTCLANGSGLNSPRPVCPRYGPRKAVNRIRPKWPLTSKLQIWAKTGSRLFADWDFICAGKVVLKKKIGEKVLHICYTSMGTW
jgi:hypothetical protein